jgi:hypothetical protein
MYPDGHPVGGYYYLLVAGRTNRTLSWPNLSGHIVWRLLPHYPWQPALLQRQIDAMYQFLELLEGRIPKLLVGEQRAFVRNQLRSPFVLSWAALA